MPQETVTINPKVKALREAAAAYSEKTGVNAQTIAIIAERFVGLLATRWENIMDVALSDDAEGKASISFSLKLDTTHKMPVGTINMSFAQTTKDSAEFAVEDPNQATLPFAEAVRQTAAPTPRPVQRVQADSAQESTTSASDAATNLTPQQRAARTRAANRLANAQAQLAA